VQAYIFGCFTLAADVDYIFTPVILEFGPGLDTEQCVNILIEDDQALEIDENFLYAFATTVDRVTLPPNDFITIVDNDGKQ